MGMGLRLRAIVLAGLLAGTAALAAPAAAQAPAPRFGGTIIAVMPDDPPTLATWTSSSFLVRMVTPQIVEGLLEQNADLTPRPGLAESWETAPDGKTITFKLRRGVTFHDGKPFTTDDVVFSVNELWLKTLPDAKARWTAAGLAVSKIDDHTVAFKLAAPYVYAPHYLAAHYGPIVPKHLYEGTDTATNPNNMKPVGTGPFRFKEYTKGSHIALERNPAYWGRDEKGAALPYLDRVVYRIMPDSTSRLLAMSKKEVDYQNYPGFPVETAAKLKELGFKISADPISGAARIQRIFVNQRTGPLANVKVRQALFHAINRAELLEKAGYGFGTVSLGPLHQGSPAYADFILKDGPKYPFDPATANKLLDEAGFPKDASGNRFTISITINRGLSGDGSIAELMRDHFAAVGVTLTIQKVDEATRLSLVGKRTYDLSMLGGVISGPSPDATRNHWNPALAAPGSGWDNMGGVDDPALFAMINAGVSELDKTKRDQIWRDFQRTVAEKAYQWDLFDVLMVSAWSPEFNGLPQRAWGPNEAFSRIWWTKGKASR